MKIEIVKGKIVIEDESIDEKTSIRNIMRSIDDNKLSHEIITQRQQKIKSEDATDTEYKYTTLTDTSSETGVDIEKVYGIELSKISNNLTKIVDIIENVKDACKIVVEAKHNDIKNPNRFNTGSVAITMETIDKPDIDQIADINKDIYGYDRIRVFDSMERKCDITIINDGSDSLYFIINRNGIDHEEEMWSQAEIMIYPGEAWKIYNVYELRIRSETQGNKYRITEDDIVSTSTIRSVT